MPKSRHCAHEQGMQGGGEGDGGGGGREGRLRAQGLRLGLGSVDAGCVGHFLLQIQASSHWGVPTTLLGPPRKQSV